MPRAEQSVIVDYVPGYKGPRWIPGPFTGTGPTTPQGPKPSLPVGPITPQMRAPLGQLRMTPMAGGMMLPQLSQFAQALPSSQPAQSLGDILSPYSADVASWMANPFSGPMPDQNRVSTPQTEALNPQISSLLGRSNMIRFPHYSGMNMPGMPTSGLGRFF